MVCRRDESTAERVHLCERTYLSCVAEVICIFTTCQTWTGGWFYCDDVVVCFAAEHLTDKWRNQTAEVGTATGTADDDIWFYIVFPKGCLCFETDDRLVQAFSSCPHAHCTTGLASRFLRDRSCMGFLLPCLFSFSFLYFLCCK